jgi:hypothetical protein
VQRRLFRWIPVVRRSGSVLVFAAAMPFLLALSSGAGAGASTPTLPSGWVPGSFWQVDASGDVSGFPRVGSTTNLQLNKPIVGRASTPDGQGYWLVAADGGVFAFGDAGFFGSTGGMHLNRPIVGIAPTTTGQGYWVVSSDGGVFSFGNASFYGSMGGQHLNQPVVGLAPTPNGRGYWLVASDGGVFSIGNASFHGSMAGAMLHAPIVGITATRSGNGYWLDGSDGGVFTFGDATFFGAVIGAPGAVVGALMPTPDQQGYWLAASSSSVGSPTRFGWAFGDTLGCWVETNSISLSPSHYVGAAAQGGYQANACGA